MLLSELKIWDWDLIFGRAMKTISSLGVCVRGMRSQDPGNKWDALYSYIHTDKISILFLPTHYMDGPLKGRVPHRLKQSAVRLLSPCLPEICHLS